MIEGKAWRRGICPSGLVQGGAVFYLREKISGLAGLAAEESATTVRVASTSLVTGGRQISVLQAW
jgi:hypothetical protein